MATSRGLVVGVATIAAAAGFVSGYLYAQNRLGEKFDQRLAEEIASAQKVYKVVRSQQFATPEEAAMYYADQEAQKAVQEYQGVKPKPEVVSSMDREPPAVYERARRWTPGVSAGEVPQDRRNNIFDDAKPDTVDFDYAEEERNRTEEAPYIIAKHEYDENDEHFNQVTLTYYEGDGVLADERDDKIDDIDTMVGNDNIPRFGHRSDDDNVVYVRNHQFSLDMEIVRDQRKYAEVVLGFVPEA
jgi:hypothetical protein